MKFSFSGLMRLKPFDESEDGPKAGAVYADSVFFTAVILANGILSLSALALAIMGSNRALEVLAIAVGISAITAGFEWHVGLKAKSLNQLFSVVLATLVFSVLNS
jgi:hypothetical protein